MPKHLMKTKFLLY